MSGLELIVIYPSVACLFDRLDLVEVCFGKA